MPGRHASADRSRFRRDLSRLIILLLLAVVVAVGVVLSVRLLNGGPEERDPVWTTAGLPTFTTGPLPTEVTTTATSRPSTTVSSTTSTVPTTPTTVLRTTTTLPPVRGPEQLTVLVLNSTRIAGLAGRLTNRLSDLGYGTLEPDNHPSQLDISVVWYVEGFDREAEVLAEEIPDANIEPFPGEEPLAPLTVVLGASYRE